MLAIKSRGHFCNYCRKIIWNKIKERIAEVGQYQTISINEAIWAVWDSHDIKLMEEFVAALGRLQPKPTAHEFNEQLKAINKKYGKGTY